MMLRLISKKLTKVLKKTLNTPLTKNVLIVLVVALRKDQNLFHVIIVEEKVKSDLARGFSQFNRLAHSAVDMVRLLVNHAECAVETEKFKAMRMSRLKYQKV